MSYPWIANIAALPPGVRREALSNPDVVDWLAHPLRWKERLTEISTHVRDDAYVVKNALVFAVKAQAVANEGTWQTVWTTGFTSTLLHIIKSEYFCGFSREHLVSSRGQDDTTLVRGYPTQTSNIGGSNRSGRPHGLS